MALSLLEQKHGVQFAAQVARLLVVFLRRNGTQSQHSIYLQYRTHLNPQIHTAQDFITSHLGERINLNDIARVARLSKRSDGFRQIHVR
jgi:transcriptional regulator GlxA family with amidase domain